MHKALGVALAAVVLFGSGCKKKEEAAADAAPEAAPVVSAAPPALAPVANEAEVARFGTEEKLNNVPEDIDRPANVRASPPNGNLILTLPKGTKVEQIAKKDRFFLIVFNDPKDQNKRLMGWVIDDVFKDAPPPPKILTCTAPAVLLQGDIKFCGKICKADNECAAN